MWNPDLHAEWIEEDEITCFFPIPSSVLTMLEEGRATGEGMEIASHTFSGRKDVYSFLSGLKVY